MSKKKKNQDFEDFMNPKEEIDPSSSISNIILNKVSNSLNPSQLKVFVKLLGIQGIVGAITLTFCPQFNLSLTSNMDLFHFFHTTFGEFLCLAICGGIFVGSGAFSTSLFMSTPEIRVVKESNALYYLVISLVFLGIFSLIGGEVSASLASAWVLGAGFTGAIAFEMSRTLKIAYNRIP